MPYLLRYLLGVHADPSDAWIGRSKFRLTPQRPLRSQKRGLVKKKVRSSGIWSFGLLTLLSDSICVYASPDLLMAQTTGFVEEMRFVAMKLHTKDQAPKEGGKEAAPQPFQKVSLCQLSQCNHSIYLFERICARKSSKFFWPSVAVATNP